MLGDFNARHTKQFNHSNITEAVGIYPSTFFVAHSLIQIVNFITFSPNSSDLNASLVDWFLISSPGSCRASQICPTDSSDDALVSVDISFDYFIRYERLGFSFANLPIAIHFLIFLPTPRFENSATEFTSCVKTGIDSFVTSQKFKVKPESSASSAGIVHRLLAFYSNLVIKYLNAKSITFSCP